MAITDPQGCISVPCPQFTDTARIMITAVCDCLETQDTWRGIWADTDRNPWGNPACPVHMDFIGPRMAERQEILAELKFVYPDKWKAILEQLGNRGLARTPR